MLTAYSNIKMFINVLFALLDFKYDERNLKKENKNEIWVKVINEAAVHAICEVISFKSSLNDADGYP